MPVATVNGLRLYYEEQGSGPPLVLLNAATGTVDEPVIGGGWATLRPFLAQRFDEGVFHITLESGAHRVLLAASKGEVRSFAEQLQSGLLASFSFISDPELYGGTNDVAVEYGDDPTLPDPRKNWVDMMYHVRGGFDGKGLVEIYANGKFIVRAKGTIGVPGPAAMRQYLRLGHNRAPMPGTSTIFFDRIRRGTSRADVEQ